MGAPNRRYAELEAIYSELDEAAVAPPPPRVSRIDVSELSVEETAARIIRIVERRRRRGSDA